MRPPICAICGNAFGPAEGGLVRFAARPSDTDWRERMQREKFVGHPPDTDWFCGEHVAAARASGHLTIDAALAQVRRPQPAIPDSEPANPWPEFDRTPIRPISPDDLAEAFRQLLAALAAVEVTSTSERDWTPMDNTFPPYCPYVDRETVRAGSLTLHLEWAHWNDTELARTSATLTGPGFTLGGHGPGGDAPEVTELLTSGELPAAVRELVARFSR